METKALNLENKKIYLIGIALIIFCYFFIDIPLAWYSYKNSLRHIKVLHTLVKMHELCMWSSAIGIIFYKYYQKINCRVSLVIITTSLSVAASQLVNEVLKIGFGRYWISTYLNHNKSLITDGVYGFNFLHGSLENSSFPSGNIALISAAMFSLCKFYPRFKLVFLIIIIADIVTIYGLNYHYVSDMIAGLLVGFYVSNAIYSLLESHK